MSRKMKGGWTVEADEPLVVDAGMMIDDDVIEIHEIGVMLLLRARQFKNNPHSSLHAGDVFVSRIDTKGGTWAVGESETDEATINSCVVLTHEENDFQAKMARYEMEGLQRDYAQTVKAIQGCNREKNEVPAEWKATYERQKARIEELKAVVDAKVFHRWEFKNTDPLPAMRML